MTINLSCGQTMMSPSCLKALACQMDTPIYYPQYWEMEEQTAAMLQTLIGTAEEILFLAGSATFGEEAAIRTLLEPGDKVVVLNAGVFGQVAVDLLRCCGCEPVEIKLPYGAPPDLDQIEQALRTPGVKALFAVHMETSTGTLYDIEALGALARRHGLLFFVDAISSLGGLDFQMGKWGVDVVLSSPQKCLCGPQGIAIVALSSRAWEAIPSGRGAGNSLCLDLEVWRRYRQEKVRAMLEAWRTGKAEPLIRGRAKHEPTPSGPLMRGLHGALTDLFAEGLENVFRRNAVSTAAVRAAVRALGLKMVADETMASPLVTVFYLPAGVYEKDFREIMLHRWGVAIGNGEIGRDNVRIGTMGLSAQPRYVLPAVAALEETLRHFGYAFSPGAGVEAAAKELASHPEVDWSKAP
ncbi:MAG TPA: alanine--glyoxylate aminotransferase family protein [Bacillota bacterium]|nr:alanine--glyoxylate aminotransferase family protein [Bacillota bacterium]